MEKFFSERTHKTPLISAEASGKIALEGICIPENIQVDFSPFIYWLDTYLKTPAEKTVMEIKLDYFNTSTASMLLNLFKMVSTVRSKGKEVTVNWYYEEDDMEIKESGLDYASILDIEFNVLPYEK